MRSPIVAAAAALAAISVPAAAQDYDAVPLDEPTMDDRALSGMAGELRDPVRQREMALMLQTMTEVLLDLPIAPLAQAAADMAGERAEDIDPDLTLRKVAPDAGRVSEEVAVVVPRAMQAMGGLAEGLSDMAPALRDMADRLRDALPRD
ncbi:hypothetical protein P8Q88_00475 [Qipengyuania sp. XHP0207]|uniref:hypothetical protein n=1 Tax=Qipengyuania sp. XHP0207 TaxID=3038078 RepID=UPI00241C3D8A|nr:hypothetical protein [Qipengyuania sp. XHP0207]MDG5746644.1 hypothetical protein [Qipengyuania sp. XHP0207]